MRRGAHVDGDVADHGRVVGQTNVLGAMLVLMLALGRLGGARLVVDNEGALDVDVDVSRVLNGVVVVVGGGLGGLRRVLRQRWWWHGGELARPGLRVIGQESCSEAELVVECWVVRAEMAAGDGR